MARIAIIVGHARKDTFCEALGQAYTRGAVAAGHAAELFVTSRMSFDPILHEGFSAVQALEPDLQHAHDVMLAAVVGRKRWLEEAEALGKAAR